MEQNRRKYERYSVELDGLLKVFKIEDRYLNSPLKPLVKVVNIGLGGLSFISDKDLPIRQDTLYQFELIQGQYIQQILYGQLVWKRNINFSQIQYGVEFQFKNPEEQARLNEFIQIIK